MPIQMMNQLCDLIKLPTFFKEFILNFIAMLPQSVQLRIYHKIFGGKSFIEQEKPRGNTYWPKYILSILSLVVIAWNIEFSNESSNQKYQRNSILNSEQNNSTMNLGNLGFLKENQSINDSSNSSCNCPQNLTSKMEKQRLIQEPIVNYHRLLQVHVTVKDRMGVNDQDVSFNGTQIKKIQSIRQCQERESWFVSMKEIHRNKPPSKQEGSSVYLEEYVALGTRMRLPTTTKNEVKSRKIYFREALVAFAFSLEEDSRERTFVVSLVQEISRYWNNSTTVIRKNDVSHDIEEKVKKSVMRRLVNIPDSNDMTSTKILPILSLNGTTAYDVDEIVSIECHISDKKAVMNETIGVSFIKTVGCLTLPIFLILITIRLLQLKSNQHDESSISDKNNDKTPKYKRFSSNPPVVTRKCSAKDFFPITYSNNFQKLKNDSRLFSNFDKVSSETSTTKESKNHSNKSTHKSTLSKYAENKMDMTKVTGQHDLVAIEHENVNRDSIDKYLCELNDVTNSEAESSSTNDVCNKPGFVQTNREVSFNFHMNEAVLIQPCPDIAKNKKRGILISDEKVDTDNNQDFISFRTKKSINNEPHYSNFDPSAQLKSISNSILYPVWEFSPSPFKKRRLELGPSDNSNIDNRSPSQQQKVNNNKRDINHLNEIPQSIDISNKSLSNRNKLKGNKLKTLSSIESERVLRSHTYSQTHPQSFV